MFYVVTFHYAPESCVRLSLDVMNCLRWEYYCFSYIYRYWSSITKNQLPRWDT